MRDYHPAALHGVQAYGFHVNTPPFNNRLLRYARNMAIDKRELSKSASAPAARLIVPPAAGYRGPESLSVEVHARPAHGRPQEMDALSFNPEGARVLLTEAGYPGSLRNDGTPLEFDVHVDNTPASLNAAEIT